MNLDPTAKNFGLAVVLHEFGHAIGLEHDHQHPYRYFEFYEGELASDPGLIDFDYKNQLLTFDNNLGTISGPCGPLSIMHYPVKSSWVDFLGTAKKIKNYMENITDDEITEIVAALLPTKNSISAKDAEFVRLLYKDRISLETFIKISLIDDEKKSIEFTVEGQSELVEIESEKPIDLYFTKIIADWQYNIAINFKGKKAFSIPTGTHLLVLRATNPNRFKPLECSVNFERK